MRFFHISDLHIGLKLLNHDLIEDQRCVLRQIIDAARKRQPDAVLVAGDIYDKALPSAEAVELFNDFICELRGAVPEADIMMISGNHDSGSRVDCFRNILSKQGVYMVGRPPVQQEDHIEKVTRLDQYGEVDFYLLPFVKPSMIKEITGTDAQGNNLSYDESLHRLFERETIDPQQRNVLVSHQFFLPSGKEVDGVERMDSEICTVGNVDAVRADVLERFDYVALGHIHKPMKVLGETCRYCGTPLACSVSEAGQEKAILEIELKEKGTVQVSRLPLVPLHPVRRIKGTLAEVLSQASGDYVSVLLTDQTENLLDEQDRIRNAFPNLLEIHRELNATSKTGDERSHMQDQEQMDPMELCKSFFEECGATEELGEDEKALLAELLNEVRGGMA